MHAFELNKHGRLVFPANCFPDLDFSTFDSLDQLAAVVQRDFDAKAPSGTDILDQIKAGTYQTKFDLMRDMALNLFWANRFKMTMYEVKPTRLADVPRHRDDVFVPIQTPWRDSDTKVSAVFSAYPNLPARWDGEVEDKIFPILFDVFSHRRNHATKLSPIVPTVAELLSAPSNQTLRLNRYDPDFRRYSYAEIIDCSEAVAELEALHRWSMVLHNQYPWSRSDAELASVSELRDDDYIVLFYPRDLHGAAVPVSRHLDPRPEGKAGRDHPRSHCTRSSIRPHRRAQRLHCAALHPGDRRCARRTGVHERRSHP